MKRHKKKTLLNLLVIAVILIGCLPNIFYKNSGVSISTGTPGNGSVKNAYQIDYKTSNSKYFSPISYFLLGTCYVNSRLYNTVKDAYLECENTCPGIDFRIMECSKKKGSNTLIHKTHRNGLSADFMVPKIKNDNQVILYDKIGLWHYLLNFNESGQLNLNRKVSIDFETMGKHIIALDNAARKNGLSISKVILKIELKDDFFNTRYGKEVRRRGIYFAQNLSKSLNNVHDDHYHVDFKLIN